MIQRPNRDEDTNELYDIRTDPLESRNLINDTAHKRLVDQLRQQLFDTLDNTAGAYIPLKPATNGQQNLRRAGGDRAANFPPQLIKRSN